MNGLEGVLVLGAGVAALAAVPFVPSVIEMFRPRDAGELNVPQDYVKNPRFFAESFRKKIEPYVADVIDGPLPHVGQLQLRKPESITVDRRFALTPKTGLQGIAVSIGDATFAADTGAHDLWIKGDADIGDRFRVWSLAVDGELTLGERCRVTRWIDCATSAIVGDESTLGLSASAAEMLLLGNGVRFQRLYGQPIVVKWSSADRLTPEPTEALLDDHAFTDRDGLSFPHDALIENDVVCEGGLRIGRRMVVRGNLKAAGNVRVLSHALIEGNIVSRSNVEIAEECTVLGDIFAEGDVSLGRDVTVGAYAANKSVYSAGKIVLGRGVRVHGAVIAEHGGIVEGLSDSARVASPEPPAVALPPSQPRAVAPLRVRTLPLAAPPPAELPGVPPPAPIAESSAARHRLPGAALGLGAVLGAGLVLFRMWRRRR